MTAARPDFAAVADIAQRLAVLTAAGVPASSAWRHIALHSGDDRVRVIAEGPADELPERIGAAAATGPAEERPAWGVLAAVWATAADAGAALAPTLDRSAGVLRSLADSAREVEVALAGPVATSRIVLALPAVGVLMGMLLGFDPVGAFVTVPGAVCLAAGAALIAAGVRWNRRLVRWAREVDPTPGLDCDLLAIALSGGGSVERARRLAADAATRAGIDVAGAGVDDVLEFSSTAGVPVVALLRAQADEQRRAARAAAATRVARLESRLLLPLGLCVLPAFVLLGVAPVAIAILSSTAASL